MPRATLSFNLPEESEEHLSSIQGADWKIAVWELDQYLRNKIKYADDNTPPLFTEALQMVRDELSSIVQSKNLSLE